MFYISRNHHYISKNKIEYTQHIQERNYRMKYFDKNERIISSFYVNKGHKNGPEIHLITENAIIWVINAHTFKLCTILIARPQQIKRYYQSTHQNIPCYLVSIAQHHVKECLNY